VTIVIGIARKRSNATPHTDPAPVLFQRERSLSHSARHAHPAVKHRLHRRLEEVIELG
jgi:hypothetical protein